MTTSPEERSPSVIADMMLDMSAAIGPHIERLKIVEGHTEPKCYGWSMEPDKDGDMRFRCGCKQWLDDKEEAESGD